MLPNSFAKREPSLSSLVCETGRVTTFTKSCSIQTVNLSQVAVTDKVPRWRYNKYIVNLPEKLWTAQRPPVLGLLPGQYLQASMAFKQTTYSKKVPWSWQKLSLWNACVAHKESCFHVRGKVAAVLHGFGVMCVRMYDVPLDDG